MVADNQFVRSFIEAQSEDAARKLVETRAGRVAGEAISRSEILEDKVEQMQHQIATLTGNIDTLHSARDSAAEERDRARNEAARATNQIASMERDFPVALQSEIVKAATAATEETKARLVPAFEAKLKNSRRWAAYWSITAIVTIIGLVGLALNWDHLNPIRRTLVVMAIAIACLGLLWIPKGAGWTLSIVGSFASVVALALAFYLTWLQFPVQDLKLPTSTTAGSKFPSLRLETIHEGPRPNGSPAKKK